MYERYEPTRLVFVDRRENLDWMTNALTRCQDHSVVLHVCGIGGIGKTTLLEHWRNSVEASMLLDFDRATGFFDRLDNLAKGAVQLGIHLRRFDLLWSIRLRFVKGVEPAKEPGRDWAFDIIKPLPFIGSVVNISKAIQVFSVKLGPKLKSRFGEVAGWLQSRLGKDYSERLLEILWKDPHHAEFLFLDALLEDLNRRKNIQQPILIMLDHFEQVDSEHPRWRYGGRKISEVELWYVFLSSLANAVGVAASRRALPKLQSEKITVEEVELTELDLASCLELLSARGVVETELQTRIISVSGGNPFVINAICDLAEIGELCLADIESLRADTLEQVRIKIWRRIFNQAEGLSEVIDSAGLIPFFDRRIMNIVAPSMKSAHWDRLTHLSFVRDRADGTWELHNLARELVIAELGDRLPILANDLAITLEKVAKEQSDVTLLGMALSAKALANESESITQLKKLQLEFLEKARNEEFLSLLRFIKFASDEGKADLLYAKAFILGNNLKRFAEAEEPYREAIRLYQGLLLKEVPPSDICRRGLIGSLSNFAIVLLETGRFSEAEVILKEAIQWSRQFAREAPGENTIRLAYSLQRYAEYLLGVWRLTEAMHTCREAIEFYQTQFETAPQEVVERWISNVAYLMIINALLYLWSSQPIKTEETLCEAIQMMRECRRKSKANLINQAFCVSTLALLFTLTDRPLEAEKAALDAAENSRDLAKTVDLPASTITYGFSLSVLGIVFQRMKRVSDAEKAFREAVAIYRELHDQQPKLYRLEIAMSLNNLGVLLRQTGRQAEAERTLKESLEIRRDLAEYNREQFIPAVAKSLTNFAVLLRQTGRLDRAEAALQEALKIRRRFAEKESEFFIPDIATSLNNLGIVLSESNEPSRAVKAFQEALKLRRDLAHKAPNLYLSALASALNNYGIQLKRNGKILEAKQAYREALDIQKQLAKKTPALYQPQVKATLINLAILLSGTSPQDPSTKKIIKKLHETGVKQIPKTETWAEDEEHSHLIRS